MNFDEIKELTQEHAWNSEEEVGIIMNSLIRSEGYKNVIESGTCTGFTSVFLAHAVPDDGKFITIDIEDYLPEKIKEYFNSRSNCEIVLESSHSYLPKVEHDSIDFAFIDSVHEEDFAKEELKHLYNSVRVGGMICLHDTVKFEGLNKIYKELKEDDRFELVTINTKNGNGLTIMKYLHK